MKEYQVIITESAFSLTEASTLKFNVAFLTIDYPSFMYNCNANGITIQLDLLLPLIQKQTRNTIRLWSKLICIH